MCDIIKSDEDFEFREISLVTDVLTRKVYNLISNKRVQEIINEIYDPSSGNEKFDLLLELMIMIAFFKFNYILNFTNLETLKINVEKNFNFNKNVIVIQIKEFFLETLIENLNNREFLITNDPINKVKLFKEIYSTKNFQEKVKTLKELLKNQINVEYTHLLTKKAQIETMQHYKELKEVTTDTVQTIFKKTSNILLQLTAILILNELYSVLDFEFQAKPYRVHIKIFPIKRKAEYDLFDMTNLIVAGKRLKTRFGKYVGSFLTTCFGSFNLCRSLDFTGGKGQLPNSRALLSRFFRYVALKTPFTWKYLKRDLGWANVKPIVLKGDYGQLREEFDKNTSGVKTDYENNLVDWIFEKHWIGEKTTEYNNRLNDFYMELFSLRFLVQDTVDAFVDYSEYRRSVYSRFYLDFVEKFLLDLVDDMRSEILTKTIGKGEIRFLPILEKYWKKITNIEIPEILKKRIEKDLDDFFKGVTKDMSIGPSGLAKLKVYDGAESYKANLKKTLHELIKEQFRWYKTQIDFSYSSFDLHVLFQKIINLYFTAGVKKRGRTATGQKYLRGFKDINKLINDDLKFKEVARISIGGKQYDFLNLMIQGSNLFMCPFFTQFILNEKVYPRPKKFDDIFEFKTFKYVWFMIQELNELAAKNVFGDLYKENFFCEINILGSLLRKVTKICCNRVYGNSISEEQIIDSRSTFNEFNYKRAILDWFVDKCLSLRIMQTHFTEDPSDFTDDESVEILREKLSRYKCVPDDDDDDDEMEEEGEDQPMEDPTNFSENFVKIDDPMDIGKKIRFDIKGKVSYSEKNLTNLSQFNFPMKIKIESAQQMSYIFYEYASYALANRINFMDEVTDDINHILRPHSFAYNVKKFKFFSAIELKKLDDLSDDIMKAISKFDSNKISLGTVLQATAIKKVGNWIRNDFIRFAFPLLFKSKRLSFDTHKSRATLYGLKKSLIDPIEQNKIGDILKLTIVKALEQILTIFGSKFADVNRFNVDDYIPLYKTVFGRTSQFNDKNVILFLGKKRQLGVTRKLVSNSLARGFMDQNSNLNKFTDVVVGSHLHKNYTIIHAYTILANSAYNKRINDITLVHDVYVRYLFQKLLKADLMGKLFIDPKRFVKRADKVRELYPLLTFGGKNVSILKKKKI